MLETEGQRPSPEKHTLNQNKWNPCQKHTTLNKLQASQAEQGLPTTLSTRLATNAHVSYGPQPGINKQFTVTIQNYNGVAESPNVNKGTTLSRCLQCHVTYLTLKVSAMPCDLSHSLGDGNAIERQRNLSHFQRVGRAM